MHSLKQRLKSNIRDEETASPKELLSSMQSNTCSEYELSDLSPSGYVFDADGEDEANSI